MSRPVTFKVTCKPSKRVCVVFGLAEDEVAGGAENSPHLTRLVIVVDYLLSDRPTAPGAPAPLQAIDLVTLFARDAIARAKVVVGGPLRVPPPPLPELCGAVCHSTGLCSIVTGVMSFSIWIGATCGPKLIVTVKRSGPAPST